MPGWSDDQVAGLAALQRLAAAGAAADEGVTAAAVAELRRLAAQYVDGPVEVTEVQDLPAVLARQADALHARDALQLLALGYGLAGMEIVYGPGLPLWGKLMGTAEREKYARDLVTRVATWTEDLP